MLHGCTLIFQNAKRIPRRNDVGSPTKRTPINSGKTSSAGDCLQYWHRHGSVVSGWLGCFTLEPGISLTWSSMRWASFFRATGARTC